MDMVKGTTIALGVLAALVLVVVGVAAAGVGTYNSLNAESKAVDAQGKQVDVQYQRAFRLVPQIVGLAEKYVQNETQLQRDVAALRSGLPSAENGTLNEKDAYTQQVTRTFNLVVEAYPQLKGDQLYQNLIDEITNTENKIAAEKVRYNDRVQTYDTHRTSCCLPVFIANTFGFGPKEYIGYTDRPNQTSFPEGQQL